MKREVSFVVSSEQSLHSKIKHLPTLPTHNHLLAPVYRKLIAPISVCSEIGIRQRTVTDGFISRG